MEDRTYKLLIVDSIMNLFRVCVVNGLFQARTTRGVASCPRGSRWVLPMYLQQKLNQFLARLQKIAEEFNLAVILTNQVQADPGVCQ